MRLVPTVLVYLAPDAAVSSGIPLHQHGELTGTQQIDCTCTVGNRLQRDAVTELNHTAAPLFKRNGMYAAVIGFCNFIRTGTVRNLIVL